MDLQTEDKDREPSVSPEEKGNEGVTGRPERGIWLDALLVCVFGILFAAFLCALVPKLVRIIGGGDVPTFADVMVLVQFAALALTPIGGLLMFGARLFAKVVKRGPRVTFNLHVCGLYIFSASAFVYLAVSVLLIVLRDFGFVE